MTALRRRPNVLLILADQLRKQSIGCYGSTLPTPNMDRLAAQGVVFDRAYCENPVCSPARASLLTGKHCMNVKTITSRPYTSNDQLMDFCEPCFAKSLTQAGYECSYIGKWHNDCGPAHTHIPRGPRRFGFDGFWAGINQWSHATHPYYYTDDGERVDAGEMWEADLHADLAVDYLRNKRAKDRPFFLMLSLVPPHAPMDLPPSRQHLLEEARRQLPALRPNVPEEVHQEATQLSIQYHACVLGIDDIVGRVMNELEQLGLTNDTLVVFMSDHGDNLLSHGLPDKNQFYEECAAIPLLFRLPQNIPAGRRAAQLTNMVDIAPTIMELCGVGSDPAVQGKSLSSLLTGESAASPNTCAYLCSGAMGGGMWDYLYGQGPMGNRRCIVSDDWKLVIMEANIGTGRVVPTQLFHLAQDPYEMNNLVNHPGYQLRLSRLVRTLWDKLYEVGDPFLTLFNQAPGYLIGKYANALPREGHGPGSGGAQK